MSDIIRLLPDSVANQIAAGEVIQRPASVIKELVENSVDAGATHITIVLRDAGRTLIQVIDDGSGMSDTDARMAFERHATSKIKDAGDLFTLHTMGFRGEALASIAAIARVELLTMKKGETIGTRLVINGSKVESQAPEACAQGSSMMVKNLFFNVPARRKFLKKDAVEMSAIMREFERLALVNINVGFTLISNDVTVHSLMPGSFKKRICDLFGKNLDKQIVPVETDTSIVSIQGFVGLPENARKRNPLQYFMVNGRNMRHPYFHKAVMQCYEKLIPADCQPNYFINLRVDPETIDVNIHPTKNEIKFENEQGIWQILTAAIRESLGRFNVGPSLEFDREDYVPEIPVFDPSSGKMPEIEIDPGYNPFGERHATRGAAFSPAPVTDWASLYDDFMRKRDEAAPEPALPEIAQPESIRPEPEDKPEDTVVTTSNAYQYRDTYILTPTRGGLMIIDQHRAHVRVLYDYYMSLADRQEFVAQATMFPETLELSAAQDAVLEDVGESLRQLGFNVSRRGERTWSIDSVPSQLIEVQAADTLLAIIENITETGLDPSEALREQLAVSMARRGAVKRGQPLSENEIDRLLSDLFRSRTPALTPDGKKVFAILSNDYLGNLLS